MKSRNDYGEGCGFRSARWALGLAMMMLTQVGCQSNPPVTGARDESPKAAEPKDATKAQAAGGTAADAAAPEVAVAVVLPAAIDTKDLDEAEKRNLRELLEAQYDPCGKSRSFLESIADPTTCDAARKLAALAVDKLAQGLSNKQVIQELLKEQARWASKVDFDVTGSPSVGEPGPGKKIVVEFFDYQCPHCKMTAGPAKELVTKHGAVLVYKMLPLEQHPAARDAALVALAAQRQGCFHALHALLFAHQEELSPEKNRALAKEAGCDVGRIEADLAEKGAGSPANLLERDLKESGEAKIQGTPTFFVDGYEVEHDQLEQALTR